MIGQAAILTAGLLLAAACAAAPPPAAPPAAETPVVVEEGYLEGAGGLPLYYRIVGASGSTVVAVHGGPGAGMNALYPDVAPLARDHRVIFYDQRGGGRSALPEDDVLLDADLFVADLEAVRAHFGLDRINLLAHSFSALLVARYAQEHPGRVGRIALLKATGPRRANAAPGPAPGEPDEAEAELRQRLWQAMSPLLEGTAEDPVAACRRYEALLGEQARRSGEPGAWRGSTCDAPPREGIVRLALECARLFCTPYVQETTYPTPARRSHGLI